MSHDEIGGTATRKERRRMARYGGPKKKFVPQPFKASDHVRKDWGPEDMIEHLEGRARGYNGTLRQVFCTAAALIRHQTSLIEGYRTQAVSEAVEAESAPVVSKRNQQPGRLSGSEREALKKFVAMAVMTPPTDDPAALMTEGRAMLAKVRKRALGVNAVEVSDEDIVADMMDPEAQETAPGKDYEDTCTGDGA